MSVRAAVRALALLAVVASAAALAAQDDPAGRGDLDAFMARVLARRDDNWTKLQQYILDERERIELRGPDHAPIWGADKEYTWYIRDGFFVRSPLRAGGARIGDADRRRYEDEFLRREREREARREQERTARPDPPDAPADVQGLIGQSREPLFVSSAYFLRFRFESGRYALVGRETFDTREVLRVEYYPAHLFSDRENRREQPRAPVAGGQPDERRREEMRRVMNKVSLVTLWVDPERHQIVRYTFENVGLDFLPTSWTWLLRIADVRATMEMGEAFPDVWLPERIDISGAILVAPGRFDLEYRLAYYDYRRADVTSTVRPGGR